MSEEKQLTKDDVIAQGIDCRNEKKYYAKQMNDSAKMCSEETGVDKKTIMKAKDYLHYKGRGWGETCMSKSEEKEKYPDRIAPTFRKLFEIINTLYAVGKQTELDDYLDTIREFGIDIKINEDAFICLSEETSKTIDRYLTAMNVFQKNITKQNEYMSDVLAEQAESVDLAPKNKYKQIIQLAASKLDGKDIADKVHDEYEKTGLFINGLATISEMSISMPEPEI